MAKRVNYSIDVPRGRQRFRELIVYVCQQCAGDFLFGATKLNKILYHADFRAFERFGTPITGMKYFKLNQGPAPKAMLPILDELEAEGVIRRNKEQNFAFDEKRTYALRDAHMDLFTLDEISLIDEVIEELRPQSATAVSDRSHGVAWRARNFKDDIPYEAVFMADLPPTGDDIAEVRELNERYGWGLRV